MSDDDLDDTNATKPWVCTAAEEELILDETLKPGDDVKSDNAKSDHAWAERSSDLEELLIVGDVAESDMEIF